MIVVDTNVVSELMRPSPSPAVVDWSRARSRQELYTTAITLAEIRYGIERIPAGRRKTRLRAIADDVFAAFDQRILAFDSAAAAAYAGIVIDRERGGQPIDGFDAQIASVCRVRKAKLATRNHKDFEGTGITLIDPWDGE